MTKKDYELIAAIIRANKPNSAFSPHDTYRTRHEQWNRMIVAFACELDATDPRFKRDVFLRDCEMES